MNQKQYNLPCLDLQIPQNRGVFLGTLLNLFEFRVLHTPNSQISFFEDLISLCLFCMQEWVLEQIQAEAWGWGTDC